MAKKIFLYLFLSLAIIAGGGVAFVYFYKDRIIQLMVGEFNKYLNAKVSVEKITLNIWETFPEVSLHFYKTRISESILGSQASLAEIRDIYFGFNLKDAIDGTVLIKDFRMENGFIDMKVTEYGAENYNIFKSDSSSEEKVKVDLKEVVLKKIAYSYTNEETHQKYSFFADWSEAKVNFKDDKFLADWTGEYLVDVIQVEKNKYFRQKSISLTSKLEVDTKEKTFTLLPSQLLLGRSAFTTQAIWNFSDNPTIDLEVNGKNTNIQTLLSLLPESISRQLSIYKSNGEVYFNGKVSGSIASHHTPNIDVQFGCKNAEFFHPQYNKQVSNANFNGNYHTDQSHSRIELNDISCSLDGSLLTGYFLMENFADPLVEVKVKTSIDLNALLEFYPVKEIKTSSGKLDLKLDFKGKISELKSNSINKNISVSGNVKLSDLFIQTSKYPLPFEGFNGEFKFVNNQIDIRELSGKVGKSEGKITGVISNLIPFLSDSGQFLRIKAKGQSNVLDVNELNPPSDKKNTGLSFSPFLELDIDYSVNNLAFNKIKATHVSTKFLLKDKKLEVKKFHANAFGGQLKVEGTCSDTLKNRFAISMKANVANTDIDSIFYAMDNFSQKFIRAENIKGQLHADFNGSFLTDRQFSILPETFTGTFKTEIKKGELVSFEPMKKLSRFVEEKELEDIRFSNLQNTFYIENKVITVPKMEIKSNLNTIWIEGTHTFDGIVDYKVKISLKNRKKKDKDAAFGAIEEDTKGNLNLFLTMKGPSDNMKIAYDTKTVGKTIKESLQREKEELKRALTGEKDEKNDKTKELNEEKFLDIQ